MWGEQRRIKRRLLRELVHENVELKAGGPSRRGRRPSRLRWSLKLASLVVAPAAVFASSLVLSGAGTVERRQPQPPPPAPAASTAPAASAAPAASIEPAASRGLTLPAARGAGGSPLPLPAPVMEAALASADAAPLAAVRAGAVDAAVFPLAVRRIVLDPGHGGGNSGTRTPGGLEEKFLTLDIARRVRETLEASSFQVLMTRDGDQSITLQERAAFANQARADIFVSIHVNWFEGVRESGIETYFLGATDDPFLTRLAARENTESGHSLAEMRELLDRIYAGVRQDKSQGLARSIHRSLYGSLSRVNPKLRDRGVKRAPFLVLVDTEMPAILAEVAALSSTAEAAMLERPLYRDYIADSLAAGIIAYAESVGKQKGS